MLRIKSYVCVQKFVKNDTFLMEFDVFERSLTSGLAPGFFSDQISSKKDEISSVICPNYKNAMFCPLFLLSFHLDGVL